MIILLINFILFFDGAQRHFQQYFSYIVAVSFIGGVKPEDTEKTTDLSQVTDKLYHIVLYTSPWSGFELTKSMVIGTDCIGSCKSNYHTITATPAPYKRLTPTLIYLRYLECSIRSSYTDWSAISLAMADIRFNTPVTRRAVTEYNIRQIGCNKNICENKICVQNSI